MVEVRLLCRKIAFKYSFNQFIRGVFSCFFVVGVNMNQQLWLVFLLMLSVLWANVGNWVQSLHLYMVKVSFPTQFIHPWRIFISHLLYFLCSFHINDENSIGNMLPIRWYCCCAGEQHIIRDFLCVWFLSRECCSCWNEVLWLQHGYSIRGEILKYWHKSNYDWTSHVMIPTKYWIRRWL